MYVKFSISIPSVLKCIPDKFSEKQNSYLFIYLFIFLLSQCDGTVYDLA